MLSKNQLLDYILSILGILSHSIGLNQLVANKSDLITKQLRECLKLYFLNLSRNILEERIPSDTSSLRSFQNLDLSQNLRIGEIPQQLGDFPWLETLNLSSSIPSNFNNISSLILILLISSNVLVCQRVLISTLKPSSRLQLKHFEITGISVIMSLV